MYYKILLHCLSHKSYTVRSASRRRVAKMISSLGGAQVSLAFIRQFRQLLAAIRVRQRFIIGCSKKYPGKDFWQYFPQQVIR